MRYSLVSGTAAADAFGSAIVTVRLRDDGGGIDSGQDTSPAQTFEITLRPVIPTSAGLRIFFGHIGPAVRE